MEAGDRALAAALADLPPVVDAIVLHPDTLTEPEAYRALGRRAVLENMDARKSAGTTVAELEALFELLPEAGFCLDVAHVWSLDPTMALGHELLDAFRLRLTHVHVSSRHARVRARAADRRARGAVRRGAGALRRRALDSRSRVTPRRGRGAGPSSRARPARSFRTSPRPARGRRPSWSTAARR